MSSEIDSKIQKCEKELESLLYEKHGIAEGQRLAEIKEVVSKIKKSKSRIAILKNRLEEIIHNLGVNPPTRHKERQELARFLYWEVPEVPAMTAAKLLSKRCPQEAMEEIGSKEVAVKVCPNCNNEFSITATSRTNLQDTLREIRRYEKHGGGVFLCDTCKKIERKEEQDEWKVEDKKRRQRQQQWAARLTDLKRMPYQAYLKTDEWNVTRKAALKRAGYRCQLCNTDERKLHVHHRTYERLGEEYAKDLITLCDDCHEKFHDIES